jgi:molecular chaperone GrpE
MTSQQRPDDAHRASDQNLPQDAPEETPTGVSSEEQFSAEAQRQRAGAAAAYASAQQSAPKTDQEPAPVPEAVAEPEPEESEDQAQHELAGQQVQQDLDELAAKAEKADEYLQLAQRTQADFENYRKRAAREAALAQDRGIAKLAKELLPAIDNLDRALKAASEEQSPIAEGIKLVHTDLLSALQRVGVEPFSPAGEVFDPQFHEAVAQQPIEGVEPGVVAEVFQQGYRLGESVLRPARVLVAG